MDDMKLSDYAVHRDVLRQLRMQIAAARFDGFRQVERAARHALLAYESGDTAGLDPFAAEVLENAKDGIFLVRNDDAAEAAE